MMMRSETPGGAREYQQSVIEVSEDSINSIEKVEEWNRVGGGGANGSGPPHAGNRHHPHMGLPNGTSSPRENGKYNRWKCIKLFEEVREKGGRVSLWPVFTPFSLERVRAAASKQG